ncbi:LPXTG cell wall anchor domain-containing protein [Glutamicibacter sp.]|uniref:LPXTG cell wall anchor domain-containing protein n=1 Tax=Glutamicibacter sp. TaxID=1931995 RepID=UPI002B499BC8|nr:LPXTG cell wall anchor domain-containing protein [Glutamicibacter sp.]HJX78150.1 LPXTG cell wall anchor domain-containing protein [Glutamicibacter sp.]
MMPSSSSTQHAAISDSGFPAPEPSSSPSQTAPESIPETETRAPSDISETYAPVAEDDSDQQQAEIPADFSEEQNAETAIPQPTESTTGPAPTTSTEPSSVPAPTAPTADIVEEKTVTEEDGPESVEGTPSPEPSESSTAEHPNSTSLLTDEDDELTPEQEEILKKLEKITPKGMDDWTEQQWKDFTQSEDGIEYDRLWDEYYETLPEWEDTLSEEQRAFWEKIDQMIPEGSDGWDEAQWDAFYSTPEGQEIERLTNEFFDEYYGDDFGFELTPEELAFFEELERRTPARSDEWSDKQWEEYLMTDEGYQLLGFFLTFEFDQIKSPEELSKLIKTYREWFDDGTGWFDDFVNRYLNGPENEPVIQPSASPAPLPGTNIHPEASEIVPAVKTVKAMSKRLQEVANPVAKKMRVAKQSSTELAETGFSSLMLAVGGVALLFVGALAMRRKRKTAVK